MFYENGVLEASELDFGGSGEGPGSPKWQIWLQFHVLRTYRRAAGEKRKAEVNANMGFLQKTMHHVNPAAGCQKPSQNLGAAPPQKGAPNGVKIEPKQFN